ILLGPLVGVAVGYFGGMVIAKAQDSGWMAGSFQKLAAVGLSLLAFTLAELIGGNGFIAAFCAGLILGNAFQRVCGRLYEFAETEGQLLTLITFLIFGSVLVIPAIDQITGSIILYSLLSLTVIRMVPVALSLSGLGLHWPTYLFLGWFGPRGIASILYGLVIVEEANLAGEGQIFTVMVTTVLLSVFAHGLTAWPAANWYGAKTEAMKDEPEMPELMTVSEMPARMSYQ
ncbi:MAG: cation:proton antiporter, partial [Anaerolineae bacterium]|nr:cation:proton antiporter [Anaerolineae bacterium]